MAKHKKLFLSLLILLLAVSYYLGYSPILLSLVILLVSLLTFFVYAKDKSAAMKGQSRVSEKTLHLLSLFFGWPGAMFAQERLRHKTKKLSFRFVFWMTVLLNLGLIFVIHTPEGAKVVRHSVNTIEALIIAKIKSEEARDTLILLIEIRS